MVTIQLKTWTVEEYHRMIEAGILTTDNQVELLNGQIVRMAPQNPPHASTTQQSDASLQSRFAGRAIVRVQLPITLSTSSSEPEPDIAIVKADPKRYSDRHPGAADILLLIEIADSTLERDLTEKALIYAQAGIGEYWVLDLVSRQAYVFREPTVEGYQSQQISPVGGAVSPIAFPDLTISFQELFLP
jgi:Uma2 family endonuclease